MKALELLLQYQYADEIGGGMMKDEIKEAISELEEFMKPKSCEGCRWKYEPYSENLPCCSCDRSVGIDYYEPKENL